MNEIITITLNTALDCVISEDDFIAHGMDEKYLNMIAAGKGLNVSRALASKGQFSICLGFVGSNDKDLFNSISSDLIKTDFIFVPGDTRKNITVSQCEDGLEHHETNPGFTISKKEKNLQKNLISSYFSPNKYIIFSGSLPKGLEVTTYKNLIEEAKAENMITVLDTTGLALKEGIKAGPYIIKPNKEELQSLTEVDLSLEDNLKSFVRNLSKENGIEYILTTLSENGALLYIRRDDSFISTPVYTDPSFDNKAVVSSVGCGDSSLAGFVYGLTHHMSDREALAFSMKCAFENLYTIVPGQLF